MDWLGRPQVLLRRQRGGGEGAGREGDMQRGEVWCGRHEVRGQARGRCWAAATGVCKDCFGGAQGTHTEVTHTCQGGALLGTVSACHKAPRLHTIQSAPPLLLRSSHRSLPPLPPALPSPSIPSAPAAAAMRFFPFPLGSGSPLTTAPAAPAGALPLPAAGLPLPLALPWRLPGGGSCWLTALVAALLPALPAALAAAQRPTSASP